MKHAFGVVAVLVALALVPLVGSAYAQQLAAKILILSIFAMSLNLLVGFGGLVSLGHAAFFGLAAYTVALMSPESEAASVWLTLPCALLVAAAAALVIGVLTLRTQGIFFIMATLAFAQMFYFLFHDGDFAGGSDGRYLLVKPKAMMGETTLLDLDDTRQFYYFTLFAAAGTYLLLGMLLQSLFGRVLLAIKHNPERARAMGYPIARFRLAGFVVSGTLTGLAGYLWAVRDGFVNPQLLGWHQSGDALMMVILGGMNALVGPALGTATLVLLEDSLADLTRHWLFWKGAFVVAVALLLPQGLAGLLQRRGGA